MHDSVRRWVERIVDQHELTQGNVLDVGSLDVNGSCRDLFNGRYVGMDVREGPGVDVVSCSWSMPFANDEFDTVLCLEMIEHDRQFWLTLPELGRVLKPGGSLLISTRAPEFPLHEHPFDYWRFTLSAMEELMRLAGMIEIVVDEDTEVPGWFAYGRKPSK